MSAAPPAPAAAASPAATELERLRRRVTELEAALATSPERARLLAAAGDVEDLFLVMAENGLFTDRGAEARQVRESAETILGAIAEGRAAARRGELDRSARALARAELVLQDAIYTTKSWLWRLRHLHQIPLLVYYLVILALLLNAASGFYDWTADDFWDIPAAAFGLGALGAILRGLYYLHRQIARRIYRQGFLLAHLAAPWIGGLFGLFTYLLLAAGILALEGVGNGDGDELATSPLALALALLAGFKWEWLLARLDRIGSGKDDDDGSADAGAVPPPPEEGAGDPDAVTPETAGTAEPPPEEPPPAPAGSPTPPATV